MAKTLLKAMRKHRRLILIIVVLVFIALLLLGFMIGPDKTWRPPEAETPVQTR